MFRKAWLVAVCALALEWAFAGFNVYDQDAGKATDTFKDSSGGVVAVATITITNIQSNVKTKAIKGGVR